MLETERKTKGERQPDSVEERMKRKMPESESSKVFENHRRYLRLGMVEDLLARVHKSLYDVSEPCIYAFSPTLFNFAHWSM